MLDPGAVPQTSNTAEWTAEPEPDPLPRRFGRLTLLRVIARGGMGEVYLATSGAIEGAERPCVVKLIRREHADDRSFLARFLDEARIQAQLHHPGVAQVLEAATDEEGKPYVVVEHVEGRNLGEVRQRARQLGSRIAWPEAVALAVMLAEALVHVHERTDTNGKPLNIVHRDLSPQNVMVGYGGEVKLIDFGTAKGENRRCHTISGIVFAKPGYVAPEVANQTPGGVPADLYAFGIMLWELVAGRRFLVGDATQHLAAVAAHRALPEPLSPVLGVPVELDAIVGKLTAPNIADRYASARLALTDLLALLQQAPSMADGERGVRSRVARLMQRLWPAEPARSRAEFARLVARSRDLSPPGGTLPSPSPPPPTSAVPDPDLLPGTRWRLLRELGRGGTGVVHEAVHADLGRPAAIKLLDAALVGSAEHERAFRDEARLVASLTHPNLVQLLDFGLTAEGRPFLAMELLTGESLDVRLSRLGPLPWREVARLGVEACRALAAAHAVGVVHGDVKPANLMVTAGGLKLLDFGLAVSRAPRAPASLDGEAPVCVRGTPDYVAPECAQGAPGDARSDLYSLGVVLYQLLTGALPHPAGSMVEALAARHAPLARSPAQLAPERGIPPMMDQIVTDTLARDPEARPASADDLRERLEQALARPDAGALRRRRLGYAALGVVLAGALGVGGLALAKPELRGALTARFAAPPVPSEASQASAPDDVPEGTELTAGMESAEVGEDPAGDGTAAAVAAAPEAEDSDESAGEPGAPSGAGEAMRAAGAGEVTTPPAAGEAMAAGTGEDAAQAEPGEAMAAGPGEGAPSTTPPDGATTAPAPCKGKRCVDLEAGLAEASALIEKGQRIRGMQLLRRVGRNHSKDPRALRAWSETAAQLKGWGEALRVARQWATVDPSSEAQIHLARMQRANGKPKEAVATLTRLMAREPQNQDARALLRLYSDAARVAKR